MSSPDIINSLFELVSGLLLALNVRRLHIDKRVRGVSVWPVAFFTLWGYWNLYFYNAVDCTLSFLGGIAVVAVNTVWVTQIIYYLRKEAAHE